MGAYVSKTNNCEVCAKTHAAVAARAYQDKAKVSAALSDLETAPLDEPLSRTFEFFVPGPKAFETGAKFLLARGYR